MIVRMWRGQVPLEKADAYLELMRTVALDDYRSTPGNRGAHVLRRDEGALAEFTMLTFWDSLDAVRAFAGDPVETAKYYDFDDDFLIAKPPTATHYQAY